MKLNLDQLYLSDITLREGRQAEGSHITEEAAKEMALRVRELTSMNGPLDDEQLKAFILENIQ